MDQLFAYQTSGNDISNSNCLKQQSTTLLKRVLVKVKRKIEEKILSFT